jgi:hypothetical protein
LSIRDVAPGRRGVPRRIIIVAGALPLVLVVAMAACPSREPQGRGPAPAPTSTPTLELPSSQPPVATAPVDAAVPDVSSPAPSGLPEDFAMLDGPCTDAADANVFCAEGKVVGVWRMVDTVQEQFPPDRVEVLADQRSKEFSPGRSLVLGVEGERLFFRLVTCGACRRIMGWAFVGNLARMSDDQLALTQTRLGLSPKPALRTREAWRAAYAADGGAGFSNKKPHSAPPGIPGECMNLPPHLPVPARCRDL